MKELTKDKFIELLGKKFRDRVLLSISSHPTATHAVLFENVTLDSSELGSKSVLLVGPDQTYKTMEQVEGGHIHDLPSMRQYPQVWCLLKEE